MDRLDTCSHMSQDPAGEPLHFLLALNWSLCLILLPQANQASDTTSTFWLFARRPKSTSDCQQANRPTHPEQRKMSALQKTLETYELLEAILHCLLAGEAVWRAAQVCRV